MLGDIPSNAGCLKPQLVLAAGYFNCTSFGYKFWAMNQTLSSYEVYNPHLPLAVYQEVAAHLAQAVGVRVNLLPQRADETPPRFDYSLSQIAGLRIEFAAEADQISQQRVQQILAYYGDRFGSWQLPA